MGTPNRNGGICWPYARILVSGLALLHAGSVHAQTARLSATTVNFENVAVGTTSTPASVRLTNSGSLPLSISSLSSLTAPFSESSTGATACPIAPATLGIRNSCTLSFTFNPASVGTDSASFTITDNSTSGATQTINLTGSAVAQATTSPTTLRFDGVAVGSTSAPRYVTLRNNLPTSLSISGAVAEGDFSLAAGGNPACGASLAAHRSCQFTVEFAPTAIGSRSGTLTITDSASNSPQVVNLTGNGVASSTTILAVTPATASVAPGASVQFTATATLPGGSTQDITSLATWSSSSSKIAAVSNASPSYGLATGVAAGTATINARLSTMTQSGALHASAVLSVTTATLTSQTIAFTSTAPAPTVGGPTYTPTATATSGLSVAFSIDATSTAGACSIASGVVSFTGAGTCLIDANQPGNANYSAAPQVQQSVTVSKPAASLTAITVTGGSALATGASESLIATGVYSDSTSQNLSSQVAWSTSASSVTSVSSAGVLSAASIGCGGPVTLTATMGSISGSLTVRVFVSGGVTCGDSMSIARDPHTSTLLLDGTLLITGGYTSAGVSNTADIYDPSIGSKASVTMTANRASHTATMLSSGQVLVVGGTDGTQPLGSIEIFTSSGYQSGSFAAFLTTGGAALPLVTPRFGHTATLLLDGTVLVTGGYDVTNTAIASAEIIDPVNKTVTQLRTGMLTPRAQHTATLLNDGSGYVLIAGGYDQTGNPQNSVELYTFTGNCCFQAVANNPSGVPFVMSDYRAGHTSTLLDDGTVLLAGGANLFANGPAPAGATADVYTPSTQSIAPTAGLITARAMHTATLLTNGTVLFAGGESSASPTTSIEAYTPAAGGTPASFAPLTAAGGTQAALTTARYAHTANLDANGEVIFAGGQDLTGAPLSTIEKFTPLVSALAPAGYSAGSLVVSPVSTSASPVQLPYPNQLQFIATATINGVTQTLSSVTWSSSDPAHLAISNDPSTFGMANTPVQISAPALVTITACFGPQSLAVAANCAQSVFSVTPAAVASVTLAPTNVFIQPSGGTQAFTVTATYTDGTSGSLPTASTPLTWTSSNAGATVSTNGLATVASSVPIGTVITITASAPGANGSTVSGTATLTVTNSLPVALLPTNTSGNYAFATSTVLNCAATSATSSTSPCPRDGKILIAGGQGLLPPQLYDPVARTFTAAGSGNSGVPNSTTLPYSMVTPRWQHTATVLDDGRVLIAGGTNAFSALTATEIYDPFTDSFAAGPTMLAGRISHTATVLHCVACTISPAAAPGAVLLAGGAPGATTQAELFDPSNSTTPIRATTGPMTQQRWWPTATAFDPTGGSGKVLIVGGYIPNITVNYTATGTCTGSSTTDTAEIYDPSTDSFTATATTLSSQGQQPGFGIAGAQPPGRAQFTSALLNNGEVFVTGGLGLNCASGGLPLNDEIYNASTGFHPVSNGTTNVGPGFTSLRCQRYSQAAALQSDGTVLVVGGADAAGSLESCNVFSLPNETFLPSSLPGVDGSYLLGGVLQTGRYFETTNLITNPASADFGGVLVVAGVSTEPCSGCFTGAPLSSVEVVQPVYANPAAAPSISYVTSGGLSGLNGATIILASSPKLYLVATGAGVTSYNSAAWSVLAGGSATSGATITNDATNSGTLYFRSPGTYTVNACLKGSSGIACGSATFTAQ